MAKRLRRIAAFVAAGVLSVPAVASAASVPAAASGASCPAQATTNPFAQWGDSANYFLVPGGNFEAPLWSSGWMGTGERTLGNEPFYVGSRTDTSSLTIRGGGVAVSPVFCVDASMPYFRFFAHALSTTGELQVRLVVQTPRGMMSIPFSRAADLPAATMTSWAPTPQLDLAASGIPTNGQAVPGRLVFTADGGAGWQIDDIYVDPFRMG